MVGTICEDYVNVQDKRKKIGKGTFGKVYQYENFGQQFAVKVVN